MTPNDTGIAQASTPPATDAPETTPMEFVPGFTSFGEDPPAPGTPPDGADAEAAPSPEAPTKIKIGDDEYDLTEALELVSKGKDYTKKTQEVAQTKAQVEAQRAEMAAIVEFAEGLKQLPPDKQVQFMEYAKSLAQGDGAATPTQSPLSVPQATVPGDLPSVDWNDLTDEGKVLAYATQAQSSEIAQLKAQLKAQSDVIQVIESAVQSELSTRAVAGASKAAKEMLGIEVAPSTLGGITKAIADAKGDPLKIIEAIQPLIKGAANAGAKSVVPNKPDTPSGSARTFNPDDHTADETYRMLQQGWTPVE